MTASFMKYQTKLEDGEDYEMAGMGLILILSYVMIFVLFLCWALYQKDETERSSNSVATKAIKKMTKTVVSKRSKGFLKGGGK
ncbi:hypothetical protein TrLO_g5152 [Triparma laevis f. longispina]|uniref:Uncharacterized protein n=1 Tax=Triparma laevis f. longispina TaxID=1714387 RepID=A0A9W7KTC2_9STRA|nr:hypothetical protein TrLO_g5152 [Triparma laevis f. longispina]